MDHSKHPRLNSAEYIESVLIDAVIYGPGNERIGTVAHVHGSGEQAQVIVDVGGFLGIGAKPVAVPARDLNFMRDENSSVHATTNWTKEQLKAMPEHRH